jgi:uncharacterized protein
MNPLSDRLLAFIGELRAAGIRISVAESIDAMNAVTAAGLERVPMREALAASLIKDEADREAFDGTFERFFGGPRRERGQHPDQRGQAESAASGRGLPGETPIAEEPAKSRPEAGRPQKKISDANKRSSSEQSRNEESDEGEQSAEEGDARERERGDQRVVEAGPGIEAARAARIRALERTPFERYSDLEYDEARDALAPLVRRFRIRLGRRLRAAKAGRIDFRRTIRAATQRGGVLIDLRRRARRSRHLDLVILADISGSVRYAAGLMLELAAGASGCFRRVSAFAYVDHLAEASFEQGHMVTSPPLDLYARSDFGRVLAELWERRTGLLTRSALVVIMGDGRNNRRPPRADLLREIARSCRGVVWLNPEDVARWGTGDSAIEQYARYVNALLPARNLHELQAAMLHVA